MPESTPPGLAELEDQLAAALDRAEDLEALVRWLALPYQTTSVDGKPTTKRPIFATRNVFTGEMLLTGPKLEELWAELFGPSEPPAPGVWVRCGECGAANIETVAYTAAELPEGELDAGVEALRMGFLES